MNVSINSSLNVGTAQSWFAEIAGTIVSENKSRLLDVIEVDYLRKSNAGLQVQLTLKTARELRTCSTKQEQHNIGPGREASDLSP